ncbi:prepilin-type N-terminal cleavage/methylation domain-containing protein [Candidatus Dojkabacteria bacterium]|nr:prepilin-type N-terminal cleavage/methylation domain-containing protein [Candidatus Dojkabacteria bacterium]
MKKILDVKLNKKGFTLIELLVAMAIIAVLIAIAAFGIQIVQRNSRNTQRRKILSDIQLVIADVQSNYQDIPRLKTDFTITADTLTINAPVAGAGSYPIPGRFSLKELPGANACSATGQNAPAVASTTLDSDDVYFGITDSAAGGTFICTMIETNGLPALFHLRVD